MQSKLTLDPDQLSVDSFEPARAVETQGNATPEAVVLTCLQTDCGRHLCCA